MHGGYRYLTAVIDWYSRSVLSWELSNTLDAAFCVEALTRAWCDGQPEIFNIDQGAQYPSSAFVGKLEDTRIRISRDGRGRAFDYIFIEWLWRSVKYEDIHLRDYGSGRDRYQGLQSYFRYFNEERPHQGLEYRTPKEVYEERKNAELQRSENGSS